MPTHATRWNLLLVDDEALVLEMLKDFFQQRNFAVSTATSARQAIRYLKQTGYDVVITDMRMETPTSGGDVIRAAKSVRPAPVAFVLSAFPLRPADWRSCGADGMFMKGGSGLDRMLSEVEYRLQQRQRRASPARHTA